MIDCLSAIILRLATRHMKRRCVMTCRAGLVLLRQPMNKGVNGLALKPGLSFKAGDCDETKSVFERIEYG